MSEKNVILSEGQTMYLSSPYIFKDKRWHFLVAGYGYGKTFINTVSVIYAINNLQGKFDFSGHGARITVAGFTLAHLELTFMRYFREWLMRTKTKYREDTKNHLFEIGTVTVFILPMENPDKLFGEDVCCLDENTEVITFDGLKKIKDVKVGDLALTRKGWKKVLKVWDRGWKQTISRFGLTATPDHKIFDNNSFKPIEEVDEKDYTVSISYDEIEKWERLAFSAKANVENLLIFAESVITDTQTANEKDLETTFTALKEKITTLLCGKQISERYRKDLSYIIKISTILTTALRTLSAYRKKNIQDCTLTKTSEADFIGKTVLEKKYQSELKEISKQKFASCAEKNILDPSTQNSALTNVRKNTIETTLQKSDTEFYASNAEKSLKAKARALCSALKNAKTVLSMSQARLSVRPKERKEFASFAEKSLKRATAVQQKLAPLRVKTSSEQTQLRHVWDLSIEGCHEFFANGILVHNCCFLEEVDELSEEKMIEACNSLSQRTRQQVKGFRTPFLAAASTAQGAKGLYRLITNYKQNGVSHILVRGWTEDNYHLGKGYIESLRKMFTPDEQEAYMHGKFINVSKTRVFPTFDWARHYVANDDVYETLTADDVIFIGQDFNTGFSRGSAWVSRNGTMWCLKRYEFAELSGCPEVYRHDFPAQKIWWIPDVTSNEQYPSLAAQMRAFDISILHRAKNFLVEDTVFLMNVLLKLGKVKFGRMAKETAQSLDVAERESDGTIGKGVTSKDWQHDADSARYAVSFMAVMLKEYKDLRKDIISHIASIRRQTEGDGEDGFSRNGYITINADEAARGLKWKKRRI